jgi:hypothetical protein
LGRLVIALFNGRLRRRVAITAFVATTIDVESDGLVASVYQGATLVAVCIE